MRSAFRTGCAVLAFALATGCTSTPSSDRVASDNLPPDLVSPVGGVALSYVQSNGIRMRIAETGDRDDPLVLLVHGWPESWYVWRHQLVALGEAGYLAVAPDLRGFGGSDKPEALESYDIHHNCADLAGVLDAVGKQTAVLVGSDIGANIVWNCALLHPDRFSAVAASVVAYYGRFPIDMMALRRMQAQGNFDHVLYFLELDDNGVGLAEQEFDADIRRSLMTIYGSGPNSPGDPPVHTDRARGEVGWLPRLKRPTGLPDWLTQADFDYLLSKYEANGFEPGIRHYRNFSRNWETTPELQGKKVQQPALMIKGEHGGDTVEELRGVLEANTADLRGVHVLEGIGHWVQQEAPEDFNRILLDFLAGL